MGWFDRFRRSEPKQELALHPNAPLRRQFSYSPVDTYIRSQQLYSGAVSRDEALSVPAVLRGRNLIASIATLPLVQYDATNTPVPNPLLMQLDSDIANVVHLAQTLQDLLFEGIGWWRITAFGWDGYPVSVRRLDPCTVSVNQQVYRSPAALPSGVDPRDGRIYVDGVEVDPRELIRFDSPNPGILHSGASVIRRAILLDRAAKTYADNPAPADYFTPGQGAEELDDDAIADFLADWQQARKLRSTAYVPQSVTYNAASNPSPRELQLAESLQQTSLEIANLMGLDPEEVGVSTTSRTYSNVNDRRRDKINETLSPYMRAITDRLSMGDVTKRGYVVRFDLSDYLKANAQERWANYTAAINLGVMSAEEVRAAEGLPPGAPARPSPSATTEPDNQPQEEPTVDASQPAAYQFGSSLTFVDLPLETFSVDAEERTIEGLAVPYGRTAKGIRFERGALQFADVKRVKLNVDHDPSQIIGVATSIKDGPNGLLAKFRIARTPEGDRALTLAADGVLDGLSVEVDFDQTRDAVADPRAKTGQLVKRADLRGVALTGSPAFDDARLTRVNASTNDEENTVPDTDLPAPVAPEPTPAAVPAQFTAEPEGRQFVNPVRPVAMVREALPYRFDRAGNFTHAEHEFSSDVVDMLRRRDFYGETPAGKRALDVIRAKFTGELTTTGDVNELNPTLNRPDMYVDLRAYRYPIWTAVNRGAPPNGVQPFTFPKRDSSTDIAVASHSEGTEPEAKDLITTSDTVTPTALSGKATISREVYDMGGNPAVSNLIMREFQRSWDEGLETAAAAYLVTLTSATDIPLTTATNAAFVTAWQGAVADLQFERGYDYDTFVATKDLFKRFVQTTDDDKRPIYPILSPVNANGTAGNRFQSVNAEGYVVIPSWALQSQAVTGHGFLFDSSVVWGWATAPQRLEFGGTNTSTGSYSPVALIDIAVFGYKAFICTDVSGVREISLTS